MIFIYTSEKENKWHGKGISFLRGAVFDLKGSKRRSRIWQSKVEIWLETQFSSHHHTSKTPFSLTNPHYLESHFHTILIPRNGKLKLPYGFLIFQLGHHHSYFPHTKFNYNILLLFFFKINKLKENKFNKIK